MTQQTVACFKSFLLLREFPSAFAFSFALCTFFEGDFSDFGRPAKSAII
jgi:hypothetical protein